MDNGDKDKITWSAPIGSLAMNVGDNSNIPFKICGGLVKIRPTKYASCAVTLGNSPSKCSRLLSFMLVPGGDA